MRYLIFNVTVLAALGYLFMASPDQSFAAISPARNAKLIGMLRLRRSATGPFQIHELQLLYHHGKAVRPLR